MNKFLDFLKRKGIGAEDLKTKSAQELAELHAEFYGEITKSIEESIEAKAPKKEIDALKKELEGAIKLISDELVETQKKLKAALEVGSTDTKDMSIKGQVKSWLLANKDKFESFKSGEIKALTIEIDTKAPALMTVGTNTGSSAYLPAREVIPGYNEIVRNQPFIEQYANTSTTSSANIVWVNMTNKEGNAAFIGEGTLKPLIDWEFATETSTAKKVAARTKVSTEMLEDIDFMAAAIENELRYEVDIKVDQQLLTGDGLTVNLKGITTYAGGYVLTTIKTTTPNNFDAIRAVIGQQVSLNYNPTHVFINPIDGANMSLVKDSTGRPLSMEYMMNGEIYRLKPIETNQIPVGSFLVADMSKFVIRNYKAFTVQYGWENDDFSKNLVSVIGERRLHAYVSANNVGAFTYAAFSTVKTAITAS